MSAPGPNVSVFERAKAIFQAALELAASERGDFLELRCGDDHALRVEVESLLGSHDRAGSFLEGSVLDPTGAFWIGRKIGDYEILALLGRGGMGLVFEARQDRPRRTVALKLLRPELADAGMRRRFEVEAELLGALKHEGIARIFEAGTVETELGPQSFLAMERIEGRSLLEYAASAELSVQDRVRLVLRVCAAVQHAHERGVIHRDLKPGNVLVESSGQPKVLDFGVARAMNADLDVESVYTQAGQLIGTVAYMSPEQARGDSERLNVRTDVYSLGVILYQLLAGRLPLPVSEKSLPEAIRILSEDAPTPLVHVAPRIPIDLATIAGKAIERESERRYESVAALGEDLRRFLANEPIRARPPSALYQLRKFGRRNRVLVGGVTSVFVLLVIGVILTATGQLREQRLRERAEKLQLDAEFALELSNFDAYAANLAVVEAALVASDTVNARSRLDMVSPGIRGWEWTHLRLRLDQSDPVIHNGAGIESMGVSADGNIVVTGGTDRSVRAWDLTTKELLWRRSLGKSFTVRGLALDPEGQLVAAARGSWFAGRGGYGPIMLLSLEDGEVLGELSGHGDVAQALAFHPTRPRLVSASSDGTVRLWDVEELGEIGVLVEHELDVQDVCFTADGQWLASAGWDGRVSIIDASTWELVRTVEVDERLTCLGFSPDGDRIVVGTWEGRLFIIDRESGSPVYLEGRHHRIVEQVRFTPDGQSVMSSGGDKTIKVHALPRGTTTGNYLGSTGVVTSFVREGERGTVLSGGLDKWIRRWSLRTRDVRKLEPHEAWVYDVSISSDGRYLASAGPAAKHDRSGSAYVKVHDLESGEVQRRIVNEGESMIWSCEFAPSSNRIVTAGTDTGAILWDAITGEALLRLPHDAALRCATFDPSGDRVATACHDLGVRIWDSRTGALVVLPMMWEQRRPFGVRFSPDGKRLAATYYGGAVALWDASDGTLVAGRVGRHTSDVYVARFSPDGRVLATAGRDRRIQLWDVDTMLPLVSPIENPSWVLDIDFSPDGSRLAVGDEAGLLQLFETVSWRQVMSLRGHRSGVRAVVFDSTGRFLFTGGADGDIRVWDGGSPAERAVDRLFGELLLADDVIAAIRSSAELDEAARAEATALAESRRLDAGELSSLARAAAMNPYLRPRDYAVAVRRARAALRSRPDDDGRLNTLGAALYRAGELEEARAVLERASASVEESPFRCAFLALTLAELGRQEAARAELENLQRLTDDERWSSDASILALLAETRKALN